MYLTKMRETAEKWCDARVTECVVSVPAYYNDYQRQAIIEACQVAGMTCLRTMNEHSACALRYGIYRTADFSDEDPKTVVFGSMGHSQFSVSIVSFTKGKLQIHSQGSNPKLMMTEES
jgi:heat shock 70kDa protein 4